MISICMLLNMYWSAKLMQDLVDVLSSSNKYQCSLSQYLAYNVNI